MATPQELQNALMLKKTQGLTTEQAVNQSRVPVTVTSQINQDRLAQNQASRQGTPAPVTPTITPSGATLDANGTVTAPTTEQNINSKLGGVIQPNGINSVQPINAVSEMPATPKVDATPGITQTPFQQAQAESEKIKAQNEAQMKLNTQQADLKAQERQQVAQETAKANTPVNQKDVLNALVSGVSVAPQNTAAYRNAQMQYKTYQKFATMTPTQLVDNMKMGEIGTETAQLLAGNPSYIKAKEDFEKFQKNQSINNMIKSVAQGATGKTTEVDHYQNASDSIAKKLGIDETNADAFVRIVSQDPETLQLTKTVSSIAKQLNTLNTERNAVYADLKSQYPDLSPSAIMTLMAGRTKEATAQIDALNSSLTLTQADLKMAMEMAKSEYDATKEDIALQAGLAKEDRAVQAQKDALQYEADFNKKQAEEELQDPAIQIKATIDEFSKLGIVAQGDITSKITEFKTSGKTLPEYISGLRSQFMSKPEYKKYQELQAGQMSDTQKMQAQQNFDIQKIKLQDSMKDKNIQRVGGTTENPIYGYFDGDKIVTVNLPTSSPAGTYNPKNDSLTTITLENGKPIKMLSEPATALATLINGNPDVKIDYNNLYRDQADQYRLYGKGRTSEQLMKEGIPSLYADPTAKQVTWTTKSQHMTGSAVDLVKPTAETIAKMNAAGFYQPEATKKAGDTGHFEYNGVTDSGYSEPDITIFNSMSPTDKKKSQDDPAYRAFLTDYSKTMKDKNAPLEDILRFSSGQNKMGDAESKSLDKFSQALGQISSIQEQISKMDTGPILGRLRNMNPYDTDAQVLKANLQALIPNLARGVYGEVGVLTDADIVNYSKTIPNLTSTQDVNNAILAMTLQTMGNGYKSQLQSLASAKNDVSGYGGLYNQYMDIVNQLKSQNKGTTQSNTSGSTVGGEIKASNGKTYF